MPKRVTEAVDVAAGRCPAGSSSAGPGPTSLYSEVHVTRHWAVHKSLFAEVMPSYIVCLGCDLDKKTVNTFRIVYGLADKKTQIVVESRSHLCTKTEVPPYELTGNGRFRFSPPFTPANDPPSTALPSA
jgi:hypothetical protein